MQACGVGGRWERAVLLLHEMEEDGSTPDAAAFQAALDVLKDAAQWERAMDVISEMDELGVRDAHELLVGICLYKKKDGNVDIHYRLLLVYFRYLWFQNRKMLVLRLNKDLTNCSGSVQQCGSAFGLKNDQLVALRLSVCPFTYRLTLLESEFRGQRDCLMPLILICCTYCFIFSNMNVKITNRCRQRSRASRRR